MNPKTIKKVINKKFNEWTETIQDEQVKTAVKNNSIITGGCIASLLLGEDVNDFDIYFRDKQTTKLVAQYYVNQWNKTKGAINNKIGCSEVVYVIDGSDVEQWKKGDKPLTSFCPNYTTDYHYDTESEAVTHMITNTSEERIKIIFPSDGIVGNRVNTQEIIEELDEIPEESLENIQEEKTKYRPVFFTTNAISLSDKIQLIIRFYGEPEEIHKTYDFEHCCCYWDSKSKDLVTPEKSLLCVLNKELFYRGSKYPVCSIFRTKKFIKRGWKINAGQYLKMCFQVSELDLKDIDVLEDQLVGVDTVYFMIVIDSLRRLKKEDKDFTFDNTYLSTIVDKIF